MADDVVDELARVDLFAGLSRKELKEIAAGSREIDHAPGRTVIDEGNTALGFHLILDGRATVTTPRGETRQLGRGDYFGEISLVDGLPRSASVVADGALRTCYLNSSTFHSLLNKHPEIAKSLLAVLAKRLRALESV